MTSAAGTVKRWLFPSEAVPCKTVYPAASNSARSFASTTSHSFLASNSFWLNCGSCFVVTIAITGVVSMRADTFTSKKVSPLSPNRFEILINIGEVAISATVAGFVTNIVAIIVAKVFILFDITKVCKRLLHGIVYFFYRNPPLANRIFIRPVLLLIKREIITFLFGANITFI